nr:hypothetical protein [uncultured Acetobacterium sp.]
MSEYNKREFTRTLIQAHLKINVPIYFFMGRSLKRRRSNSEDEVARLHLTAVILRVVREGVSDKAASIQ